MPNPIGAPGGAQRTYRDTQLQQLEAKVPLSTGTIVGDAGHARPVDTAGAVMNVRIDGERVKLTIPFFHPSMPTELEAALKPDGSFEVDKLHLASTSNPMIEVSLKVEGQITGSNLRAGYSTKIVTTPRYGAYDTDSHWGTGTATLKNLNAARPATMDSTAAPTAEPTSGDPGQGSIDRTMWGDLMDAAGTGQGITKAELRKVVDKHASDGPKGLLTVTERRALKRAVDEGQFARSGTAGIADQIATGAGISLLDARSLSAAPPAPSTPAAPAAPAAPTSPPKDPYFWGSLDKLSSGWAEGHASFPADVQVRLRDIAKQATSTDLNQRLQQLVSALESDPSTQNIRVALERSQSTGYHSIGSRRVPGHTAVHYDVAFADANDRRLSVHDEVGVPPRRSNGRLSAGSHGPSGLVHD